MSDSGQINDHFQRDIQVACKRAIEQFRQVAALKSLTTCTFENAIYVFAVSDSQSVPEEIAWITQLNTPEQALEFKTWLEQVEQ